MAIDFPTSPATNDTYTYNGRTWKFNGSAWDFISNTYAPEFTNPNFIATTEGINISATSATGTIDFNALTASIWYYTANASGNFTLNFRGNASTSLSSILNTNEAMTLVFFNTNGTTAYYPTAFQIDATSVTPIWQNGSAPTFGNSSAVDAYSFTITKLSSTPTYTVFASQVKYS